jgi:hypothetical protein
VGILRKDRLPRLKRWGIILVVLTTIIVGAILWIVSSKGSVASIISIIFASLGLIFSFFQLFPVEKSHNAPTSNDTPQPRTNTLEILSTPALQKERRIKHGQLFGPDNLLREDWEEAPRIGRLYGREKELADLQQWLVEDRCRLVALSGIGGIGKTSLAAALTAQMKTSFTHIFWRSLQNAPSLAVILPDCIRFVSNQQQADLPEDIDRQIPLLLRYLQEHRCLIVLDNVESVMQTGSRSEQYQPGFEGYGRLIQRIGEAEHQSCLLLTSREKPGEVVRLEGNASPTRSMALSGVGQAAGRELLADAGLFGTDETWTAFIHLYSGNPLALKLVSEPIRELFGGDIAKFLQAGGIVFGGLHELLDQQFHRLSKQERELLYWLAIEREAVSIEDLHGTFARPVSKGTLLGALNSLRRHSMIEPRGNGYFTLQPVIMEFVTASFVEQVVKDITNGTIRVFGSYSLMKAQAQEYVRESHKRLILEPVAAQLSSNMGRKKSEQKLRAILSTLRTTSEERPGYAAGNVLNLLIYLQSDLRGADFSHLPVWQAYLQGVMLPEVNFTHADLAGSVFTETFGNILAVALSPNRELLAAGTATGEIQLWQLPGGTPFLTLRSHLDWVRTIAFSPDGTTLIGGSHDGTIKLWDIRTGDCVQMLRNDRPYERMNITGIRGITTAQKVMLKTLGAIEGRFIE